MTQKSAGTAIQNKWKKDILPLFKKQQKQKFEGEMIMKSKSRRFLSTLLAAMMVLGLIAAMPMTAGAANA